MKPLQASASSSLDGSRAKGIEMEGASLGSTMAGWAETAATNAVEVPAAMVATCMILSLQTPQSPTSDGSEVTRLHIPYHPSRDPERPIS